MVPPFDEAAIETSSTNDFNLRQPFQGESNNAGLLILIHGEIEMIFNLRIPGPILTQS
jgi:hypothetical protein